MNWRAVCTVTLLATVAAFMAPPVCASEEGEHGHSFYRNTIYAFLGVTGKERRDRAGTWAFEYERRFNQRWGLAGGVERAAGEFDFTVVTLPVILHAGQWGFLAGPGAERPKDSDWEFLVRTGVFYEWESGGALVTPKIVADFVDGDVVLVYGIALGFGF